METRLKTVTFTGVGPTPSVSSERLTKSRGARFQGASLGTPGKSLSPALLKEKTGVGCSREPQVLSAQSL